MPKIDVNFQDVPDKVQAIPTGIYSMRIDGVPDIVPTKKGTGTCLVVKLVMTEEGKYKGAKLQDYIFMNDRGHVKIGHLIKSAGLEAPGPEGLDSEELAEKDVRVKLTSRTFTDDDGDEQESNSVKDYIV